jgi:hypothetical protein
MGHLIAGLDQAREIALLRESESARNLLGYGVKAIREGAFIETTRDPILTMLSIGMEKLHKLFLGAVAFESEGKWPSKAVMKARGHGLVEMHDALVGEFASRAARSTPYVKGLVAGVQNDAVVKSLLEALDVYGRMGRFYYLDLLGDAPQEWIGPNEAWTAIETAALSDPVLARLREDVFAKPSDSALWDSLLQALNERIAVTVELIWVMVTDSGKNHLAGRAGEVLGFEADPAAVGRQ